MKHLRTAAIALPTLAFPTESSTLARGEIKGIIPHSHRGHRRQLAFQTQWATLQQRQSRTSGRFRHQKNNPPKYQQRSADENFWRPASRRVPVKQGLLQEDAVEEQRALLEGRTTEDNVSSGLLLHEGRGGNSMITSVQVDNLAMVASVKVKLGRGLVAITGETGAGKSLISSAFSLAAGARVRGGDVVGSNGPTARVELKLELGEEHRKATSSVRRVLDRLGVPVAEDGRKLIVTRIIGGKGSTASVNGCSVKVGKLRDLMASLIYTVDANGAELFSRANDRLRMLDRMLDPAELALVEKVRRVISKLKEAEACRTRLEQRCRFERGPGDEDASLLHHWVEELDQFAEDEWRFMDKMRSFANDFVDDWGEAMLGPLAEPILGETSTAEVDGGASSLVDEEGLTELWPRLSRIHESMQNLEASRTKVELARQLVVDQSNPNSIANAVGKIRDLLVDAETENVGLSQELLRVTHDDLNSLEDCMKRAGDKLEKSVEGLPTLPISLEEVEGRIAKWKDLSRKHGVLPERLGSMQAQLRTELDELGVAAEALPHAKEKENHWRIMAELATSELSAIRRRAAVEMEQLVNPMMGDVGLKGATFEVQVEKAKTLGPSGGDRVQFAMKANQGRTEGAVDAVASSGEKSRLLLLLEAQLPPPQARSNFELEGQGFDGDTQTREDAVNTGERGALRMEKAVIGPAVRSDVTPAYPCAVLYDEIDAHVGGRTAVAVGRLLANQGRKHQVVVVTHTASVAALADQHLVVEKNMLESRPAAIPDAALDDATAPSLEAERNPSPLRRLLYHTSGEEGSRGMSIAVREVQGRDREEEVARMAAGDMGGGAASDLAREMLQYSRRRRYSAEHTSPR